MDDDASDLGAAVPPADRAWPEVMTVAQAAEFLQMTPRRLSNMAQAGEIPARKAGNAWKFSRPALHRWLGCEIDAPADKVSPRAEGRQGRSSSDLAT